MIVGATGESDRHILTLTQSLYDTYHLKRVFYSAYVPVVENTLLPSLDTKPPLLREHRLYQADWLLRFYGFRAGELLDEGQPDFDPLLDPKCAAARSRHRRGKREAHPCRAPRRGAARRGPQKARRRAQAGAVFSHLLWPKHRSAAALA